MEMEIEMESQKPTPIHSFRNPGLIRPMGEKADKPLAQLTTPKIGPEKGAQLARIAEAALAWMEEDQLT